MAAMMDSEREAMKEEFAVKIQCAIRCAIARRRVGARRQARKEAEELAAAQLRSVCMLQRIAHGMFARRYVRKLHRSAVKIQGIVRKKQACNVRLFLAMEAVLAAHSWNTLHYATHHSNLNAMRAALEGTDLAGNNVDQDGQFIVPCAVDARGGNGETALHIACGLGCRPAVEYLLANGADINVQDKNGWTPLRWATEGCCNSAFLWYLVVDSQANVALGAKDGCTPIHNAALHGDYNALVALFEGNKLPQQRVMERCEEVLTEARALNARRKLLNELATYLEGDLELTEAAKQAAAQLPEDQRPAKPEGAEAEEFKVCVLALLSVLKELCLQPYRGEGFNNKGLMAEAEVVQERNAIQKEETADLSDEEFMQLEWDKKVDLCTLSELLSNCAAGSRNGTTR